jgi:hypothetical protein
MELFAKLFHSLLVFIYHCFDHILIHGYLSGLSRPEQVVRAPAPARNGSVPLSAWPPRRLALR